MNKYRARRTTVDGISFHSAGEARRWQELRLLERAGAIRAVKRQVPIYLHADAQDGYVGKYVADFFYYEHSGGDWREVYEDFKGHDTPLSKWKRRHALKEHGIDVRLTGAASRRRAA